MVVYPEGNWYGGIEGTDDLDVILDSIESGTVAQKFLIA
jgi:(2Fe-2S) ferredoxin